MNDALVVLLGILAILLGLSIPVLIVMEVRRHRSIARRKYLMRRWFHEK